MTAAALLLSALHWLGVALYTGSLVFHLIIFQSIYERYRMYRYVDNFRGEVVLLFWKLLHVAFFLIVLTGVALAGLKGKSTVTGTYGLVFSSKLALWLLQLWLLQEPLKPFMLADESEKTENRALPGRARSWLIVFLLFLIFTGGFILKHIAWQ